MITRSAFGVDRHDQPIDAIRLTNVHGTDVCVLTLGGIIQSLRTRDRDGELGDIVLGYDALQPYLANPVYFGALIGPNANRIGRGVFTLDGHAYALTINNGVNHLHGGAHGFHQKRWSADTFERAGACGVVLTASSTAGDDGYPGGVQARVTYTLHDDHRFSIAYHATCDAPTLVNLTQHSYFNLSGYVGTTILDHRLEIAASRFLPVDSTLIPTGEWRDVTGTPFDFREADQIARDVDAADEQLSYGAGYDHNWVLDGARRVAGVGARANDTGDDAGDNAGDVAGAPVPTFAARLAHPASGRALALYTSEPGLQVYTGGAMPAGIIGKGGVEYSAFAGVALETQHFPDAPNHAAFPSTVLRPGETYASVTEWHFRVL